MAANPGIADQLCKPNLEQPNFYQPPGGRNAFIQYPCSRCHTNGTLTKVWQERCPARKDRSMSILRFKTITRGKRLAVVAKLSKKVTAKRNYCNISEESKAKKRAYMQARYQAGKEKFKAYAWAKNMLRCGDEKAKHLAHRRHLHLVRKLKGLGKKQVVTEAMLAKKRARYKAKAADPEWRKAINKQSHHNRVLRIGFTAKVAYRPKKLKAKVA